MLRGVFKGLQSQGQLSRLLSANFGQSTKAPVHVAVTGAAGQIGYSLTVRIASGEMLGKDQPVVLHLIDLPHAEDGLKGVAMEISDCAFPLVSQIIATTDQNIGFKDIDYALLVGAKPRGPGMERADLLKDNANIFRQTGDFISANAKKTAKVLVVGNPCNTMCLILQHYVKGIPKENFTAMTRLDHNRALFQIADKVGCHVNEIKKFAIFGNHSPTMVPYIEQTTVKGKKLTELVDQAWINQFIPRVQQRGAEIIKARKLSSAASAANAAMNHITTWVNGTHGIYSLKHQQKGQWTSMAVESDGSYGIPKGLICSFPLTIENGKYTIVKDQPVSQFYQTQIDKTVKELVDERSAIEHLLK